MTPKTIPTGRQLAAYAAPAVFLAALYLPLFTYVTPFYAAERGIDLASLGAVWIAIRLFDAVSDPAVGWLSDRTPARFGRRRLWLALSVPLIAFACWQVFAPPAGAGLGHVALWLFLLTLGWTMAQTPYAAWGAEMTPDYDGKARITAWREAMVLVGTIVATIAYGLGGGGGAGLHVVALVVVIGLPLGVALALALVPEPDAEAGLVASRRLGFSAGWGALRENRPFRRLLLAWFVNGAANALPATLFLFFVEYRLEAPGDAWWLVLLYFLAALAGVPFWTRLAARVSKHRAWGMAMLWACLIFAVAPLLGPGDVAAFAAVSILTGVALGADLSLPPAIQADVVDLDTRRTGARRAGLYFAIWQVATKAALALASGLALLALDRAGFVAAPGNSPAALMVLGLLYAVAPIVLKLGAVALMWRFQLDRAEVERLALVRN